MTKAFVSFLLFLLAATTVSEAALTGETGSTRRLVWPAAEDQPVISPDPEEQPIVRFIEATDGEFTVARVESALDTVFADLAEVDVEALPEFLANVAALGLETDVGAALRARLLTIVGASELTPELKDQARAAITASPPAMVDTATLPYDGVCNAKERFADPDCPPLITGPVR